jgi:uncharacterized phage protein (TIGR01671 family)
MREILFRGKRIDNGDWVRGGFHEHTKRTPCPIGDSIQTEDIACLIIKSGFSDWNMPKPIQGYEVDPKTVDLYTGFNDDSKKPVKIFGGDVLRGSWQESVDDYSSQTLWVEAVVSWDSENGKWIVTEIPSLETYDLADWMPERKVIGNIYDNTELLEQQHD